MSDDQVEKLKAFAFAGMALMVEWFYWKHFGIGFKVLNPHSLKLNSKLPPLTAQVVILPTALNNFTASTADLLGAQATGSTPEESLDRLRWILATRQPDRIIIIKR
jgi:hypothetical protein